MQQSHARLCQQTHNYLAIGGLCSDRYSMLNLLIGATSVFKFMSYNCKLPIVLPLALNSAFSGLYEWPTEWVLTFCAQKPKQKAFNNNDETDNDINNDDDGNDKDNDSNINNRHRSSGVVHNVSVTHADGFKGTIPESGIQAMSVVTDFEIQGNSFEGAIQGSGLQAMRGCEVQSPAGSFRVSRGTICSSPGVGVHLLFCCPPFLVKPFRYGSTF
eukprot:2497706-Amphidinium_carterae.1